MPKSRGESADFVLSQHQVEDVLKACQDLEDKLVIGLALFCGLRIGEIAHFNNTWVTEEGNIKIPSQMSCNCAECMRVRGGTWKPKTKAGSRTLPIPQRMKGDLVELLRVKPFGLSTSRVGLYYRTKRVLIRAGVRFKGLSDDTGFPHCLRATCAQMLALGGMSAVGLCAFMGWKSIVIGDPYTRASKAKELAIVEAKAIFG